MTTFPICRCGCGLPVKRAEGIYRSMLCARTHREYLRRAAFFRAELKRLTCEGRKITTENILDCFQMVYARGLDFGFRAKTRRDARLA